MDSNPSQPLVSTPVDTGMHKEVTGGLTSLRVTSEARADPQLSSDMSAFNLNKPIYLASFIVHYESASGNNALAVSTAEADPGNFAPSDFVPQQQGINEGTKNTSYDHLFVDDLVIVVDNSNEDEKYEIHATENVKTKDTSVPKSLSPRNPFTRSLNMYKEYLAEFWYSAIALDNSKLDHGLKQSGMEKQFQLKGLSKRVFYILGGASFIVHSESASGNNALAVSTAEADPGNFAPSDFVPQQQGINEGTKNTSYDHLFVDDLVIVMDNSNEDEEDEIHATENVKTKDTSVPKSLSPKSSQI
nr:hypothetical protein [Tanacetum cinerariifolium]